MTIIVFIMIVLVIPIVVAVKYFDVNELIIPFIFLGILIWILLMMLFNFFYNDNMELISKTENVLYNITENGKILESYHLLSTDGKIIVNEGKIQTHYVFDEIIYSDKNSMVVEFYDIKNVDEFPFNLFPKILNGYDKRILYIKK